MTTWQVIDPTFSQLLLHYPSHMAVQALSELHQHGTKHMRSAAAALRQTFEDLEVEWGSVADSTATSGAGALLGSLQPSRAGSSRGSSAGSYGGSSTYDASQVEDQEDEFDPEGRLFKVSHSRLTLVKPQSRGHLCLT